MNLPFEDIRVIEFSQIAAGPFAGMLLADMGADVIKIESREGDGMRQWPPHSQGFSENFASLNRNKRSVALDLKDPADIELAVSLCAGADAIIENFRPGVMDRLGLGYDKLSKLAPRLIYCSISAFGQEGPRRHEGGFDVTLQAISGIMSVTGEPDGAPVKCGVPLTDFASGLYAAYAIAAALRRVSKEGRGCRLDVPMLGASLGIAALQVSEYFGNRRDPQKLGSAHPRNAPYQAFKCKDGYFVMAAGNDDLYRRACEAVDRLDLVADPRFASTPLRAKNQTVLKELLEQTFAGLTAERCLALMRERGVPCAPINSYSAALADEQVKHYGWLQPMTLPGGAQATAFAMPVRMDGETLAIRRPPPALDEHKAEIVREVAAGRSPAQR